MSIWSVAIPVGVVLGAYVLVFASLSRRWMVLSVLLILCLLVLLIVPNTKRLLLSIHLLEIPIQLDIYLNHRQQAEEMNALSGFNFSLTTVCLLVLYILWWTDSLTKNPTAHRPLVRASVPLILYFAAVALSVLFAQDYELAAFELFLLAQAYLLFIYIVHATRTRKDVLFVVTMLAIGLLMQGLLMIGLRGIGHSVSIATILARIDGGQRVGGTIGSPNGAASYLGLLLLPVLSLLFTQESRSYKWLVAVASVWVQWACS